ncbi:MAG: prepilin-type N-terminal cleavage/methylation domain-containing protein [Deferribacteraceae bacterium]|jgi:prepilin-type N-terminal cleavage/methylation domain-containing protein|nr:prepilin-type N-terminal cleavage/methylation domain-containing protein [Deferribacteraceae bacterium]
MNIKAFTLVEVLVAMSILGISMLGIYGVLNNALFTTKNTQNRLYLIDKGYERILKHTHYPRIAQSDTESDNGTETEYEYIKKNTLLPGVTEITMVVKNKDAVINYVYFERTK